MLQGRPRIAFVCVENACRSQMAEGFARRLAGDRAEIWSAGSRPAGRVHPRAQALMREIGVDLSSQRSKGLDALPAGTFDAVITMGCGDACPHVPARIREDWDLQDPKNLPDAEFRRVRDEIERRVKELLLRLEIPLQGTEGGSHGP